GDVTVTANNLRITDGGQISSSTFGIGQGGTVNVTANSLLIDGAGTATGIFAFTQGDGNAGSLAVRANNLRITDGGQILSSAFEEFGFVPQGSGGNVNVTANTLLIDGLLTGIAAESFSMGNAGSVAVHARNLRITNGGSISTSVFQQGSGGNVNVMADSPLMGGAGSGIFAESRSPYASADAGSIAVGASNLTLTDGGQISSSTFGTGQ